MVNNCAACTRSVRSTVPTLTCSNCDSIFHASCLNIQDFRKITDEEKTIWVCPLCQSRKPKKDNSNTPIRGAPAVLTVNDERSATISPRDLTRNIDTPMPSPTNIIPLTPQNDNMSLLLAEVRLLRQDISDMKSDMKSITDHVKNCMSRIDEHESKIDDALSRLALMEQREQSIIQCENTIAELRYQLNMREQAHLKNEVEISGITEHPEENPMHLVCVIANKIGLSMNSSDIDFATRVGPRNKDQSVSSGGADTVPSQTPRPLVVRFVRRHGRDDLLKAARSRRTNLTTEDIDVAGPKINVWLNERLTQENRKLFRLARKLSKPAGYKYYWVKNATVYIRKQQGNPAIPIRNIGDLQCRFEIPPQ